MLPAAAIVAAVLIVVGSAHLLFQGYFPGPNGMGHDYGFFLPDLLANYYWSKSEGPWSPPWFTPAFCGGQPAFPDPQSIYYSLPQALAAFADPVNSVYGTLLAFVALGFAGTYLFLRRSLALSQAAAVVGATVFALNGFFSHRMLIGHLAFHGIMLVPWLALALTVPDSHRRARAANVVLWGTAAALVFAYWIVGGMVVLVIPAILAVIALVLVHGLAGGSLRVLPARAAVAVLLSLGLTASKVAGVLAYISHVPRTAYLLPGMGDVWSTLKIAATALFLAPANIAVLAAGRLTNNQWQLGRHEFEFGVTPVPLVLMGLGLALWIYRRARGGDGPKAAGWRTLGLGAALILLLCLPIAVNTYGPGWNAFLKSVPVVGSASNLFRWFLIYIPVVAALSALAIDSFSPAGRVRGAVAAVAFLAVLAAHSQVDRRYYASQHYDPRPVAAAFQEARTPDFVPTIRLIGAYFDPAGRIILNGNNDLLTRGASQLGCYNPMFGYGLEFFPVGTLHPGSPLEARDGYLNVKDPACYLYPAENRCVPGSHFPAGRQADAERFLGYHSYPFSRSAVQHVADLVNRIALVAVPALLVWGFLWRRRVSGQGRDSGPNARPLPGEETPGRKGEDL